MLIMKDVRRRADEDNLVLESPPLGEVVRPECGKEQFIQRNGTVASSRALAEPKQAGSIVSRQKRPFIRLTKNSRGQRWQDGARRQTGFAAELKRCFPDNIVGVGH